MALHDDYARITPFELILPDPDRADEWVAAVEEEATGRGIELSEPTSLMTLGSVAAFLSRIEGEGGEAAPHSYGLLAYHAVHFVRAGRPLYLLGTHAARYLVGGAPATADGATLQPPRSAGYLQLPRHLFWLEDGSETPDSVDGLFWHSTPGGELHVLVASAVRRDGDGVSVASLPRAPLADAPTWLSMDIRGDGSDFSTRMPGSELDGLYGLASAGEVLKLLVRFFAQAAAVPAALLAVDPPGAGRQDDKPEPSRLPFVRVNLEG